MALDTSFFGRGLVRPFRRDARSDFLSSEDVALIRANVGQILGTRARGNGLQGEVRWDGRIGSKLHLLRHSNNNPALGELGRVYVIEALSQEPRIRVNAVEAVAASAGTDTLQLRVRYDILTQPGGDVLLAGVEDVFRIQ